MICKIKEDHVIKDMSFQLVNLVEVISINLVSHDHSYYYKLMVEEDKTSTELISILTKRILKQFPDKSKNEFYFIYKGKKLNLSNRTLQDLGIKNGETFFAYEIKPLLDENLEFEVSVIMDQSNTHEINFDFKLKGLLKFCLIKDMSLIINSDIDYYTTKINKKVKHILEIISGGNIDLNETQNSIMSVLKKFEGINILNFSRFIDSFIPNEELIEIFNIFKEKDKEIIQKENDCLTSYSEYMKKNSKKSLKNQESKVYSNGE